MNFIHNRGLIPRYLRNSSAPGNLQGLTNDDDSMTNRDQIQYQTELGIQEKSNLIG